MKAGNYYSCQRGVKITVDMTNRCFALGNFKCAIINYYTGISGENSVSAMILFNKLRGSISEKRCEIEFSLGELQLRGVMGTNCKAIAD